MKTKTRKTKKSFEETLQGRLDKPTKYKVAYDAPKPYSASIKVLGKIFNSTGSSIREAIANLKPLKGQGVAILTVKHGDKAKDKILPAPQTFRLFNASPMMREVALKHVSLLFDGSL